ncbi:hypothetical protein E3Q08_03579 [Wallemia mellicola]|uniref:phosphomannomutase n=1 Tax=Wallemia mellicola TaxID=1708541 RepID=A0AB38MXJ7_9BASI|nr:hypothetical protein E3Q24_03444 [Wallemia mellicola]TIB88685.1 hypothetical protein E3Q21_00799 [Wallemia mellicola]TIB91445.1 hypothetical protein E3Q20_00785 [Wallemia mellicola]TIC07162.1 hypothetical protein E3Q16_00647 [Wallemia mellicola]TIC25914.1 hypothetical protein E3Q12_00776 [Wallemia mellicola]
MTGEFNDREFKDVICLFDVDNTLAPAQRIIRNDMIELIAELRKKCVWEAKITNQLGGSQELMLKSFDYAFAENGLTAFRLSKPIETQSFIEFLGEERYKKLVNFCLHYIADIDIPIKRGTFIDYRNGMVNISPIGRNASIEERDIFEAYDKKFNIRQTFVKKLKEAFPDYGLTYSIGGQISFDAFPTGWDKTYALRHIKADNFKIIHFFGDKTFEMNIKQEVSDNPGSMTVASPHKSDVVQQDVDRKMRFYSVLQAFKASRYPSNAQIEETLKYVEESAPFDVSKLSTEGKKLVQDARNIISTANTIVQEKNKDEKIQEFLYKTRQADYSKGKPDEIVPGFTKDGSKEEGQKALEHLRTVFTLIATNSEVRKLLSDSKIIGQDLFADAASKAAKVARPNEEKLAKIDESAPEGWKSKDGRVVGADETPEYDLPKLKKAKKETEEGQEKAEDVKKAALERQDEVKDTAAKQADDTTKKVDSKTNQQSDVSDIQKAVNEAGQEKADETKAGEKAQEGKNKTKSVADSGKQSLKDKIPSEYRDKAKENYEKSKKHLEEKFPKERRDKFIERLKKVLYENQKHKDWREAFEFFFKQFEIYYSHAKSAGNTGKQSVNSVFQDQNVKGAANDLRTVLERFANGRSASPIFDAFHNLITTFANDKEISAWFERLIEYIRKLVLEPGYVLKEQASTDGDKIGKDARAIFESDKYKGSIKDKLFKEVSDFFGAMGEDPLNKKFGSDINKLFRDLLFDEQGKWAFKSHLWADIRDHIVPPVVESIGAVPIPRIEYTDPKLDIVIENLVLQGKNLLPNYVIAEAYNKVKFSPYQKIKNEHQHDVKIELGQIQCDLRDVAFYLKKKTGFKISDAGLADVFLGGKGVGAKIHLSVRGGTEDVFEVKSVKASVGTLKFNIKDSKHNILYKTARPLATSLIKKQIVKAIEDGIRGGLENLNTKLVEIKKEIDAAEKNDDKNSTKGSIIKSKFSSKKDKESNASASQSQFKIVANRNSKLIDAGHSKGWINLQAKYEDQVKEGESWRSKAFSIVPSKSNKTTKK